MAQHRFTINQLTNKKSEEYLEDRSLLMMIISDRMNSCSNVNAPLYTRLAELYKKVDNNEKLSI